MDSALLINKSITIATWIAVYLLLCPKAKSLHRSRLKWFIYGAAAMWGTIILATISLTMVNLYLLNEPSDEHPISQATLERQVQIVMLSRALGWVALFMLRRRLVRLGELPLGQESGAVDSRVAR